VRTDADTSDGYMAVDALVALTIFASTIVFALAAAHQGLRASRSGLEVRQANDLLTYLLESSRDASAVADGQTDAFLWHLAVGDPLPSAAAASLCVHQVTLTSLHSRKTYVARTTEICPAASS
jgi:hypothetical protein